MFSSKIESKLDEIQSLERKRKVAVIELNQLTATSEKYKNEVVYKSNELGSLDNKLQQGYIALSKLLSE